MQHQDYNQQEKWRVTPYDDVGFGVGTQEAKRLEAKLVSLYAVVVFTGLLLLSGALVMYSDEVPTWISRVLRPDQQALASSLSQLPRENVFRENPLMNRLATHRPNP